jgi:hypothetical protein
MSCIVRVTGVVRSVQETAFAVGKAVNLITELGNIKPLGQRLNGGCRRNWQNNVPVDGRSLGSRVLAVSGISGLLLLLDS